MGKPKKKSKKTKFENNWMTKNLENLEKDYWEKPEYSSNLVITIHKLRKQPLKDFDTENLRIMIGQNIGLKFLIPLAINILEKNIFAEGDLYEGDLLKSVLTSDIDYWKSEPENWSRMCEIIKDNFVEIEKDASEYDTGRQILKSFKIFETYFKNIV